MSEADPSQAPGAPADERRVNERSPDDFDAVTEGVEADDGDDAIVGRAVTWSLALLGFAGVVAGLVFVVKNRQAVIAPPTPVPEVRQRVTTQQPLPTVPWTDITAEARVTFTHENGARGEKLLPETMGGGVALFDYDGDGDADLLLVGSCRWEAYAALQNGEPLSVDEPSSLALYRNDQSGEEIRFTDVTAEAGLDRVLYGMGPAVGDIDGDGDLDLYITALGENVLFRNDAGRFVDITAESGVGGSADAWSTATGFVDYDGDGDLDLVAVSYLDWSWESDTAQDFRLTGGGRAYGRPQNFGGALPFLFRNDGTADGTTRFTEVAEQAGLHVRNPDTDVPAMKSLGLGIDDFNGDRWPDLLVANDTVRNCLFLNDRDGTFTESAVSSGVAFDDMGHARGAMGVDVARFREDGSLGVVIGNFATEMTALYVDPASEALFDDEAIATGLGPQTRLQLTFGVLWVDVDLDGRLDIVCANGHLEEDIARVQPSQTYEQPPQLFWNAGDEGTTEFVPLRESQLTADFLRPMVGRGVAAADLDLDGDTDLVLTQVAGPPRILRNDVLSTSRESGEGPKVVRIVGAPLGSDVSVKAGQTQLRRRVTPTRGYLSQSESPVTISLPAGVEDVQVIVAPPVGTGEPAGAASTVRSRRLRSDDVSRLRVLRFPDDFSEAVLDDTLAETL